MLKGKIKKFVLDHEILKIVLDWIGSLFVTALSAFIFAYGFRSFIAPKDVPHLVSGGASGISQVIVGIVSIFTDKVDTNLFNLLTSIAYFVINIPIFFLAWFKIGKRFTILTFFNVLLVSLFNEILPEAMTEVLFSKFDSAGNVISIGIETEPIARALFAGILTGVHSSLAYVIGSSAGGMDVIALYIAERKSTSIGKYSMSINAAIVLSYVLVNIVNQNNDNNSAAVIMALYTCIYFFTSSKVIDVLNTKNKKTELQIFTSSDQMAAVLLHAFPHGCTIVDAKGGYTGSSKKIIYMVVSYNEVKKAIKIMRDVDENCFVTVVNSYQVYGKFYIRPLR